MARKVMYVIAGLIILGGIGLLSYPSFANYINQYFANKEISEYDDTISSYSEQELQNALNMAYAYNATLPGGYPADPFTGNNISNFTGTEFEDFFMVQQGEMLGYVEVPIINVYLPIYYGTEEATLEKGAGLVDNTSLPVGGSGTHAVISAHTGLASKKLFTDLNQVKEGDIFFIHVLNQHFAYQVNQIKIVLPAETDDLYIEKDRDYVTLLTCTPFGVNDHRLLVRGERIDYDFSENEKSTESLQVTNSKYVWMWVLAVFIIVILLLLGYVKVRKNKGRKRL